MVRKNDMSPIITLRERQNRTTVLVATIQVTRKLVSTHLGASVCQISSNQICRSAAETNIRTFTSVLGDHVRTASTERRHRAPTIVGKRGTTNDSTRVHRTYECSCRHRSRHRNLKVPR